MSIHIKIYLNFVLSLLILLPPAYVSSESHEEGKKFKLGVILPLSGKQEFVGKVHRNIEKLLARDAEDFKEHLDIIYEDSARDVNSAVEAFKKLVSIDRVDAIYGLGAPVLTALAPLAEGQKMPYFAPESDTREVNGKKYVTLFRNDIGEFGRALWEQFRIDRKKTIAIVKNSEQALDLYVRGLSENTGAGEVVSVEIDQPLGTSDFRKQLLKLKLKKFDLLGLFMFPDSLGHFLSQAQTAGISAQIFGNEQFFGLQGNREFESLVEGSLVVAPYITQEFRERYRKEFSSGPGLEHGVEYYDFLSLLDREIVTRGEAFETSEQFLDAMRFYGERHGISGTMVVKTNARQGVYYSRPIAIYRMLKGVPVLLRQFDRPK